MSAPGWLHHRLAPGAAVVIGYLLSRLVFVGLLGIRFDASSLSWFWQYIDPALLRTDPWWSLYYHHAQPPLYNAYLALALGLVDGDPSPMLAANALVFGLLLHCALFGLLVRLGVRPWLAVGAALGFAISPASILYESWLFYTYPMALVLVLAALALHRLVTRGGRFGDALLFSALLAVAVLTRSLFHLIWMAAILASITLALPASRRSILLGATLPLTLVLAVYCKNEVEFDSFSTSTWLGMNLARLTTEPIPLDERRALQREGVIGEVSLVPPFSRVDRYPGQLRAKASLHPVLRDPVKSTGAVNYNHVAYIHLSRAYAEDAFRLIVREPGRYLGNVAHAWMLFAMPLSEYWFLDRNRAKIAAYDDAWNAVVYGVASTFTTREVPYDRKNPEYVAHRFSIFWTIIALAALSIGLRTGLRDCRMAEGDRARGHTLLFMTTTCLWVAFAGNALEFRENNRFRFMIEPFVWALAFWMLQLALERWGPRGRGRLDSDQPHGDVTQPPA